MFEIEKVKYENPRAKNAPVSKYKPVVDAAVKIFGELVNKDDSFFIDADKVALKNINYVLKCLAQKYPKTQGIKIVTSKLFIIEPAKKGDEKSGEKVYKGIRIWRKEFNVIDTK